MDGGEGVGYHKLQGEPVVYEIPSETYTAVVGAASPTEWLKYEVDFESSEMYSVQVCTANACGDGDVQPGFNVYIDDELVISNGIVVQTSAWLLHRHLFHC